MAKDEERGALPWLFRREVVERGTGTAQLDPAGAMYRLYANTRNPYLKRAIAPSAPKLERTPQELGKLFRFFEAEQAYRIAAVNETPAHRKRGLSHPPPPSAPQPRFSEPDRLPGDIFRLPWLIDVFFRSILQRLDQDPGNFEEVVSELVALFRTHGIRIRLYEAYYALEDWEDLMSTLREIAQYPAPETFDLFCSALLTYYDLVYPPDA